MIEKTFQEELMLKKEMNKKIWDICHYWYFLDKAFKYGPFLCDGCHDLMQKAINFDDFANFSVKGIDYRIHF